MPVREIIGKALGFGIVSLSCILGGVLVFYGPHAYNDYLNVPLAIVLLLMGVGVGGAGVLITGGAASGVGDGGHRQAARGARGRGRRRGRRPPDDEHCRLEHRRPAGDRLPAGLDPGRLHHRGHPLTLIAGRRPGPRRDPGEHAPPGPANAVPTAAS
jgi:hypothetical protein